MARGQPLRMPHLMDYDRCLKVAKEVALEAGNSLFLPNYVKSMADKKIDIKDGNTSNLVTETDRNLQAFIQKRLAEEFPAHKFMGEESAEADVDELSLTDDPTWIVDPIDGTTNFVHQFKFTVISIGLSVGKQAVVGVIFCPVSGELFEASLGGGARCNGRPLRIDANGSNDFKLNLNQSLILTELGATGEGATLATQLKLQHIAKLIEHRVHGIRMLGSAAFNLVQIASSSAQVYFEQGIHAWDITAGVIIVREAGGCIRECRSIDSEGCQSFRLNGRSIIATASSELMNEFCQLLGFSAQK